LTLHDNRCLYPAPLLIVKAIILYDRRMNEFERKIVIILPIARLWLVINTITFQPIRVKQGMTALLQLVEKQSPITSVTVDYWPPFCEKRRSSLWRWLWFSEIWIAAAIIPNELELWSLNRATIFSDAAETSSLIKATSIHWR